ncbi:ACT domain-containing protein ACR6 [Capsicum annuum]|uniref:ACT domain-containing protein ACR n=1 Tax=Capsicum annuum TaxID=4072 RepID=A0A2G2Y665_CAPAN|nr:ACT domain-containing protein ACR6 [Capsicum annuum]
MPCHSASIIDYLKHTANVIRYFPTQVYHLSSFRGLKFMHQSYLHYFSLEKDYNVITMRSRDRPKLLFDIVCSLTGMQYVVFHGVVHIRKMEAYQEFYIQHIDGLPISSEGPELELCTEDRLGLLSHITRILRKNGLCAERAEISTFLSRMPKIHFFINVAGNPMDQNTVDSICEQVGPNILSIGKQTYRIVEFFLLL